MSMSASNHEVTQMTTSQAKFHYIQL